MSPGGATSRGGAALRGAAACLALAATLAGLLWLAARPVATDDAWWHLAMGATYWREGPWPDAEPLLHTAGSRRPVPHEWLFQVGLHGLHAAAGFIGLRVFHALAVLGVVAGAFALLRRASRDTALAAFATLAFVTVSWFRLIQLRPDLWTVPALLGLHALLFARDELPSRGRVGAAVALLVVWANAHSLFMIGLALILAAWLGTLLFAGLARAVPGARGDPALAQNALRSRRLAVALVLGGLATLLNPQGIEQHLTFLTEARSGSIFQLQDDFRPWNPLHPGADAAALTGLSWLAMDAIFAAFALLSARSGARFVREPGLQRLRALDPVQLGLGAAAFVACLVSVRFHWLAFLPLYALARRARHAAPALRWAAVVGSAALALAWPRAVGLAAYAREVEREPAGYAAPWLDARYCGAGVRFLDEAGLRGRLYNPFNLGGFLGYWLAPRMRTFIDGRLDHVAPPVLDDYRAIRRTSLSGPGVRLRQLLDRWKIDVFFADAFDESEYAGRRSGTHLRRLPEWMLVHVGPSHAIYLRRGPRSRRNLARVAAWYRGRGVPFDPARGLDVSRVMREARGWAEAQGLLPPEFDQLEVLRRSSLPEVRAVALEALAAHAWRIAWFEAEVERDRELVELRPEAFEPRRRLADGLIQLDRPGEALPVARRLRRDHPHEPEAEYLLHAARVGAGWRGARERGGEGGGGPAMDPQE